MSHNNKVECCFLSRTDRYIFECLLDNKERSKALCRHLLPMPNNTHLGASFVASPRETYKDLPYLAEYFVTSDGHKVFVDLHHIFKTIIETITQNKCDLFHNVDLPPNFTLSSVMSPEDCKIEFLDPQQQPQMMIIQPIFHADPLGRGFYPSEINPWTLDFLIDAMSHQRSGQQAVILFLALHSAIESIHPAKHIDSEYVRLLNEARSYGVKIATAKITADSLNKPIVTFNSMFELDQQSY